MQSGVQVMVRKAVPLQPEEVQGEADIHLQYLQDPTLVQPVPVGFYPMERTHSGTVLEELQPECDEQKES